MLAQRQILVIEDNSKLQGILADFLELKGAQVDFASSGEQGLALALAHPFDAIILDVMLPNMSGLDVATALRQQGCATPILMLTALNGQADLVAGFDSGVDDFVSKPFQFPELEARLVALIKRYHGQMAQTQLQYGELVANFRHHQISRQGRPLVLSPTLYQILLTLIQARGNVVSREEMIQQLWPDQQPDKDVLRSHIYLLRNALDKPFERPLLVTVPRVGFRLQL